MTIDLGDYPLIKLACEHPAELHELISSVQESKKALDAYMDTDTSIIDSERQCELARLNLSIAAINLRDAALALGGKLKEKGVYGN